MKWEDAQVETLNTVMESYNGEEVPYSEVVDLAESLGKSERSVAAKLRALGADVEKKNAPASKWPEELAEQLRTMISEGKNDVEIAEALGKTVRQVRGKALSMQLMEDLIIVKSDKPAPEKKFTDEQTETVREMAENGEFIEDIAEAVGKNVRQVRGKLLSLKLTAPQREKKESKKQKVYTEEVIEQVTEMVNEGMTAEEIAETLELNLTGLKSWLGRNKMQTPDMGSNKAPKYTEEDFAVMREMAENGASVEEVAERLNRSVQSIRVMAGKQKIKFEKAA